MHRHNGLLVMYICGCEKTMFFIGKTQLENVQNTLRLARLVVKKYHEGEIDEADLIDLEELLDVFEEEGN